MREELPPKMAELKEKLEDDGWEVMSIKRIAGGSLIRTRLQCFCFGVALGMLIVLVGLRLGE